MEDSAQKPVQTSLPPKPRPAQRIAPAAIDAPDMEMDIGAESREAAPRKRLRRKSHRSRRRKRREAAAPEIVTEAETPSAAPVVTANAPARSVRPRSRPAPRAAPAPEPLEPDAEAPQIDPVTAALNAALMAGDATPGRRRLQRHLWQSNLFVVCSWRLQNVGTLAPCHRRPCRRLWWWRWN